MVDFFLKEIGFIADGWLQHVHNLGSVKTVPVTSYIEILHGTYNYTEAEKRGREKEFRSSVDVNHEAGRGFPFTASSGPYQKTEMWLSWLKVIMSL